jgi:hypothetical protein
VLFTDGVRFLARNGTLPEAVQSCVNQRDWLKLGKHMAARAELITAQRIFLQRPSLPKDGSIEDTLRAIESMITSGRAICVFLRGSTRHYSVISGYTPQSLRLFDSFGYRRVLRRSCGTRTSMSLHRFHLQSIITFEA